MDFTWRDVDGALKQGNLRNLDPVFFSKMCLLFGIFCIINEKA